MPVEFLGIGATNDGSETRPRRGASFDTRVHAAPGPRPRGERLGPRAHRLRLGQPGPGAGGGVHRQQHRARCSCCSPTGRTCRSRRSRPRPFATLDQISDGRLTRALHHRRQRPRAAARGRLPDQGRALRPHAASTSRSSSRRGPSHEPFDHDGEHYRFADFVSDVFPVQQPRPDDLVRRLVAGGVRGRRGRGRHLLPVGRAAGRHRRADRDDQGGGRGRRPHRRRRGSRSPSARSSAPPRSRRGRRPTASSRPSPAAQAASPAARSPARYTAQPGEHRLAAAARRSPSRASASTGRCGPAPPPPPAGPATPTPSSARRRRWPPRCSTTTTSASTSSRPAATTCSTTPSSSAAGDPDRPRGGRQARPGTARRCLTLAAAS